MYIVPCIYKSCIQLNNISESCSIGIERDFYFSIWEWLYAIQTKLKHEKGILAVGTFYDFDTTTPILYNGLALTNCM